jgi:methylated-DNA-protein-cysteine methyltransferase related protein
MERRRGSETETMTDEKNRHARDAQTKSDLDADVNSPGYRGRVFEIVRRIPKGRVMTYGQLADILGEGYTPRTVGFVMHSADETVPWQRVINSQGACSTGRVILPPDLQQRMLEAEGVVFDARGRCELARYRWTPEEFAGADEAEDDSQPSLFSD